MEALVLASPRLRAVVLPQVGAKIVSLAVDGREMLWRNPHVPVRAAPYGARYRDSGASGIDVCCPSIAPCVLVHPRWGAVEVPDHGEVWTTPWRVEILSDAARLCTEGRCLPYRLCMTLRVDGRVLTIRTRLQNLADEAFPYQWALHPAFPLTENTRLEGFDPAAGLDRPGLVAEGFAAKTFSGLLTQGEAELFQEGHRLRFRWDVLALPYLGVWISNEDETQPGGRHCIAVEPSAAPDDSLTSVAAAGLAPVLGPREVRTWWVSVGARVG